MPAYFIVEAMTLSVIVAMAVMNDMAAPWQ